MRILVQLVKKATLEASFDDKVVKTVSINKGALVTVGFLKGDSPQTLAKAVKQVIKRRFVPDARGKINSSLKDLRLDLLVIPNFTLGALFTFGQRRIAFNNVLEASLARQLFDLFVKKLEAEYTGKVESGVFGSMMDIEAEFYGPYNYAFDV